MVGLQMKPTRRGFLKGLGAIAAGAVVNESIALSEYKHIEYSIPVRLNEPKLYKFNGKALVEWDDPTPYFTGETITYLRPKPSQCNAKTMKELLCQFNN